jgi:hypothetical protein
MKASNENDGSRRDFILTSAKIAIGSTLTGAIMPQAVAQGDGEKTPPGPAPGPGDPADHPGGEQYFKGKMKWPGWLPDKATDPGNDNLNHHRFPEEAIHKGDNGFDAFPVPGTQAPFEDPIPFLGVPFDDTPGNLNSNFDKLLGNITNCARNYNAALYWMRRLHFHLKAKLYPKDFIINTAPPRNPHGDDDPNNDLASWDLKRFDPAQTPIDNPVTKAQAAWEGAVTALTNALTPGFDVPPTIPPHPTKFFKQIWADMVQVNGYIVSARVVAVGVNDKGQHARELGGSSSSHISISSAFSSH